MMARCDAEILHNDCWSWYRESGQRKKTTISPLGNPKLSPSGEVSATSPHSCEQMRKANRSRSQKRPCRLDE